MKHLMLRFSVYYGILDLVTIAIQDIRNENAVSAPTSLQGEVRPEPNETLNFHLLGTLEFDQRSHRLL